MQGVKKKNRRENRDWPPKKNWEKKKLKRKKNEKRERERRGKIGEGGRVVLGKGKKMER